MILDKELLRRYAETGSEEEFAELVRRHLDLVYSAALRQVNGDAQMAQDVAQMVFIDLARKAGALSHHQFLTGWFYTSTHFAAANAVRKEQRRRRHEQEGLAMHDLLQTPSPDVDWDQLWPVLDRAMHELKETDRTVILMRYFEKRPFADIGEKLGLSEDTVRKRVERAVEKLRSRLGKKGFTTSAALGTVLSAHAVQMAPVGLVAIVASKSVLSVVSGAGATFTLAKAISMTKIQGVILGGFVGVCVLAPFVMQQRALVNLRTENVTLRADANRLAELVRENQSMSQELAAMRTTQSLPTDQFLELLRLRGEAGVQKNELKELRAKQALAPDSDRIQAAKVRASKNYYPKESWAAAGFGTPESTVQSLSWAASHGDFKAAMACMSPEAQAEVTKHFEGKTPAEISGEIDSDASHFGRVDGLRIVNEKALPDGEVILTYYIQGVDGWGSVRVKQFGSEWKISGDPGKF